MKWFYVLLITEADRSFVNSYLVFSFINLTNK